MQHTLVAVFDNRTDAQNAMNELLSSNFPRQDVQLSNADPTGMTDSTTGARATNTDADDGQGIGASIKNFFTDLFGADNSEHASRYEGAVTRGHHVLTVTADSLPEVERAADIVERYGPTDIDEQASGEGAMGAGAGGMSGMSGMSDSMRMSGAGGMQQSAGLSQQSDAGALQGAAQLSGGQGLTNQQLDNTGDRKLFAQQSLNQAEPMGQTYQEPMGKSGLSATGGTSFQGSTLQENSVQASSLEGTQGTDVSFQSSAQQGGTIRGSALEGSIQQGVSSGGLGGMQGDAIGASDSGARLGSQPAAQTGSMQRDTAMSTGTTGTSATMTGGAQSIPVVEEQLKVGKREIQRGGVRIYSRMVETPVNESVSLREEHVDVQRRPVDRPLSDAETAFREQSIEMRETAEEAVVEKSARIVEEVTVGKQVTERQEQIHDTVRHTEVDVQRMDGGTTAMSDLRGDDSYFRNHFDSTYGASGASYDDYAPAYSYGSEVARSGKYSGRQWDQVERDLQSDWDTRNTGGPSTWDKMKSAVRHGWDRMTDDDANDREYRSHWNATYSTSTDAGSYDDFKPAYAYGSSMAQDPKYRGRQWGEVENDLRSDWDTRYGSGGQSTWEKMKSAVRHGWDRMTS